MQTSTEEPALESNPPSKTSSDQGTLKKSGTGLRIISILFRVSVVIVILMIAMGIGSALIATKKKPAHSGEAAAPISVRTMTARLMSVDRTWDGFGTAQSMNDADVVAEVAGRVIDRPAEIEPGERISAGTVLLRLDAQDYRNALQAAEQAASALEAQIEGLNIESERIGTQVELANDEIEAAERDLERTRQAIQAGAGNQGEIDSKTAALRRVQRETESLRQQLELIPTRRAQLLAQLSGQRANAAMANDNLERSVIRSPINGIIQSVEARAGDWVAMGTPVVRVVDLTKLEIPIRLPAGALGWIDKGDEVQLWSKDPQGTPDQTGIITRIAPEVDPQSRTISVYVEVEQNADSPTRLSPGRFVLARVQSPDDRTRYVVPRRAIQSGRLLIAESDEEGVTRVGVRQVVIDYSIDGTIDGLDQSEDQWTVIGKGLVEGDQVIISLLDQVSQGMEIDLLEASSSEDAMEDSP